MSQPLAFGRPAGAIIQYAYTIADIETSVRTYIDRFQVGPWFCRGPFTARNATYRGKPGPLTVTLARAFVGDTMIELIQQHDLNPSIYREVIDSRGYGFHHFAVATRDFDFELQRLGYPVVFEDSTPTGARVAYIDSTNDLPGFLEIIELDEPMEHLYEGFRAAAASWDGSDPLRDG